MNNTVTDYLTTASGISHYHILNLLLCMIVLNKILIGNTIDSFTLTFDTRIYYDNDTTNTDCSNKNIFTHYLKWGFPYFIGFNKETYNSTKTTTDIEFLYNDVGDTLCLFQIVW